jgi:1-acyl-sn-glycerol-3-phosphate acyltransferase
VSRGLFSWSEVLRHDLPGLADSPPSDRAICRVGAWLAGHHTVSVDGLEHIDPRHDPVIVALNHNQKLEAVLVPLLLIYLRGGARIRFLSDWMYQLIPVVGWVIRRGYPITVTNKPARPRWLNRFKHRYQQPGTALERAQQALESGESVGIFPEGRINRDRLRLLQGHSGAAALSLATGRPIVPIGIRFPELVVDRKIGDFDRIALRLGQPLWPSRRAGDRRSELDDLAACHRAVMGEIARLSGKSWAPFRN